VAELWTGCVKDEFLGDGSSYAIVCPVCLSVCYVGVLWPNGRMDQDVTWQGGRHRPGDIVSDGDAAPPPPKKKGGTAAARTFRPVSIMLKELDP